MAFPLMHIVFRYDMKSWLHQFVSPGLLPILSFKIKGRKTAIGKVLDVGLQTNRYCPKKSLCCLLKLREGGSTVAKEPPACARCTCVNSLVTEAMRQRSPNENTGFEKPEAFRLRLLCSMASKGKQKSKTNRQTKVNF